MINNKAFKEIMVNEDENIVTYVIPPEALNIPPIKLSTVFHLNPEQERLIKELDTKDNYSVIASSNLFGTITVFIVFDDKSFIKLFEYYYSCLVDNNLLKTNVEKHFLSEYKINKSISFVANFEI